MIFHVFQIALRSTHLLNLVALHSIVVYVFLDPPFLSGHFGLTGPWDSVIPTLLSAPSAHYAFCCIMFWDHHYGHMNLLCFGRLLFGKHLSLPLLYAVIELTHYSYLPPLVASSDAS